MNFKFLKATFAGLVLLAGTANAGVIEIDFTALDDAGSFNEYSYQNTGSLSVVEDVLTLSTDSWFSLDLVDIVGLDSLNTTNTVLSFDFMTTSIAELTGIAFFDSAKPSSDDAFTLIGTQGWWGAQGITYTDVNEWIHFEINLGDFITSNFSKLMFYNDCDDCSGLDITASFKNMTISSPDITEVPVPATLALFALAGLGLTSRRVKK